MKGNRWFGFPYVPLTAEWVVAQFIYDIIRQSGDPFSTRIMPEQDISGESDSAKLDQILAVTGCARLPICRCDPFEPPVVRSCRQSPLHGSKS